MNKTIAVIASCDTKYKEVAYMRECLARSGVDALVVDMAIGPSASDCADVSREDVAASVGLDWNEIRDKTKGELMELMTPAVKATVLRLFKENAIHGVLSVGGVQNTTVATTAMRALPIGFPTVVATTVASGPRTFGGVCGDKDIVVIPSISDFTGINLMTERIIANACACVAGMAIHSGQPIRKGARPVVGLTLMGITNNGAVAAVEELDRLGIEAIGFHSTGVGGRIMESLAEDGILDGILDLTTHEITTEFFAGGYSYGALDRIVKPAKQGVPLVVAPGGLDFVDFAKPEFPPRMDERVYNMHNAQLAHIKILPDEAEKIGAIFASRLNLAERGVRLLIPTEGMRKNTRPGGNMYMKETDDVLIGTILADIGPNVSVETIPGNIDDEEWGKQAARAMAAELERRGVIAKGK